jgi:hypothetical protein
MMPQCRDAACCPARRCGSHAARAPHCRCRVAAADGRMPQKEGGSTFITMAANGRECSRAVSVPGSLRNVSGQRTRLRASLEQQRGSAMRRGQHDCRWRAAGSRDSLLRKHALHGLELRAAECAWRAFAARRMPLRLQRHERGPQVRELVVELSAARQAVGRTSMAEAHSPCPPEPTGR